MGHLLYEECQDNYNYFKEMLKLQKLMHESNPKAIDKKHKSSIKLFEIAAEMCEKEDKFRNSIVVCLLKASLSTFYWSAQY